MTWKKKKKPRESNPDSSQMEWAVFILHFTLVADPPPQPEVIPNPLVTKMTVSDETEDYVFDTKL